MKKLGIVTVAATALTAGFLSLAAPAAAAPSAVGNAQQTISSLEAQGYSVIVNRLSDKPLRDADVVSIGGAQTFTHTVSGANNDRDKNFGPVTKTNVHVYVK